MEPVPYSQLKKGSLLVASPDIEGGIYFRAVILLCEHNASGSFGLIINKSVDIELPEEVLNLKDISNPKVQIRAGGTIQPNQMMLLHSSDQIPEQSLNVCDGVFLGGDLDFLQGAMNNTSGPSVYLTFGYSGWGPGQLESEFLSGLWFLHPGNAHHVFETAPEDMWKSVLRDMGGKYAALSMIPEDLSLN